MKKLYEYGRWVALAAVLVMAIPLRANAWDHWDHWHYRHYNRVVVPAYSVAPRYVAIATVAPVYAGVPSYRVVPSYGTVAPVYPYAYPYHLSKHQMAAYNQLGRMERYAAMHPIP